MIPEYIELTGCNKWIELMNINYILNVALVRLFKKYIVLIILFIDFVLNVYILQYQ